MLFAVYGYIMTIPVPHDMQEMTGSPCRWQLIQMMLQPDENLCGGGGYGPTAEQHSLLGAV